MKVSENIMLSSTHKPADIQLGFTRVQWEQGAKHREVHSSKYSYTQCCMGFPDGVNAV